MPRVQFVETVALPLGPGGSLIPVPGIGTIPHTIDEATGNEGSQAPAYAGRTGNTQASSLATDSTGTISYWLEAGDYNIHFQDQQSPPRIQSFVRGFNAALIDTSQVIVGAQNLIQFVGDYKFSGQVTDHGLRPDGTYEWLLIFSDNSGNSRLIDHTLYQGLWQALGSPTPNSQGKFALPNLSGRALVAAGQAAGLTNRQLYQMFGHEAVALNDPNQNAPHGHTLDAINSGVTIDSVGTGAGVRIDSANAVSNPSFYVPIIAQSNIFSAGSGSSGATAWAPSASSVGWVASQLGHNHGVHFDDPGHNHTLHDPNHNHTLHSSGGSTAHENTQPSAVLNLFIKS